jgi:diguanylate cyclase (GGDEF)-like protein
MRESKRTKAELAAEVAALRQKVEDLETFKRVYEWIEEGLSKAHNYDNLTGLPSWTLFFNQLSQAVALAQRNDRRLAVLFFSLDSLKLINDNLGQQTGDLLLTEVAGRIADSLRKSDVLARPGRNEFMILLPEIGRAEDVVQVTERILTVVSAPILLNDRELVVTGNIGISIYPNDWASAKILIRRAYTAMLRAREKGRNVYRFYSAGLNDRAFSRLLLENNLRIALEREEFSLHYQPQVDMASGHIVGFEALLRWRHPEFGLVSPAEFVPIIEEIGLIAPLSEWVLRTACAQNRAFREANFPPMTTAVNLSPRQLYQSDLADIVGRVLKETGLEPHSLELELTEGALVRNVAATANTLRDLNGMGVKIAIDDFGIGYSSLSYLRHFPINKLKIDKTFVDSITTDPSNEAISRAIITLAHSLRITVVAEGVETAEQMEMLRAMGCDEAQGYLISRPISADDLTRLLAENAGRGQLRKDLQIPVGTESGDGVPESVAAQPPASL